MTEKRRVAIVLEANLPFKRHVGVFAGTQRFAAECENWDCFIDETADYELPADGKGPIPYDGIIARANRRLALRAKLCGVPLVNVWINSPAKGVPSVFIDREAVGRMAAEHLLDRGLRSFACLRYESDKAHDAAELGFVNCLGEGGFECKTSLAGPPEPETRAQWRQLKRNFDQCIDGWKSPVGLLLMTTGYERHLVQMCSARGLRVPEDVAIIVTHDETEYCSYPPPSLTSIRPAYDKNGYEAARLLQRLMDEKEEGPGGKEKGSAQKRVLTPFPPILIPPEGLVVRQSTDFHAVDDETVADALQFISANSHKPISVDDVAAAVLVSRTTLKSRFRKHLGRSISAEIRRLRVERAKRQLANSKRRISDIATEVGFGDQNRMNVVFHRELGMTPSAYRKKHKASGN